MGLAMALRNIFRKIIPHSLRNKIHLFLINLVKQRDGGSNDFTASDQIGSSNIEIQNRELIGIIHMLDRRISSLENDLWIAKQKINNLKGEL